MRLMALVGASCALAACTGGGGTPDADSGPPGEIELGTATVGTPQSLFAPIVAEQELGVVTGPQGGHHFIVHAHMKNLAPGDPTRPGRPEDPATTFAAFVDDGAGERQVDLQNPPFRLGYEDVDGDGWLDLPSGRILQFVESEVVGLIGQRVHIVVTIVDQFGKVATDDRWVVARRWEELHPPDAGVPDADVPADAGVPADADLPDGGR